MHVLIPYALSDDAAFREPVLEALRNPSNTVALPRLQALLQTLQPSVRLQWPELHPVAPHEHWLAQARGLDPAAPPWAALRARELGLATDTSACWAFLTPAHWELGQTRVSLRDPDELDLQADEAQALRTAMAGFFSEDGLALHADTPGRWLVCGEPLRGLVGTAPERVIGRDVAPWLPESALLRRLQSEMQMLLYTHAVNDARSARGSWVVNGFWLHGMGALPSGYAGSGTKSSATSGRMPGQLPEQVPEVWDDLRAHALRLDAGGWLQAWRAVDERLSALVDGQRAGQPVTLTLAGDHHLHHYTPAPASWWARLRHRLSPPTLSEILVVT